MNQKQFFFVLATVSVVIVIFYAKYNSAISLMSPHVEEVVVYKEKDIMSLLGSLNLNNKVIPKDNVLQTIAKNITKTNNVKQLHDYLKKYPQFMDCKKKDIKKWASGSAQSTITNYAVPAPQLSQDRDYLRAIIIYFPIELVENFRLEFKWLYRSWIEMQKSEPTKVSLITTYKWQVFF